MVGQSEITRWLSLVRAEYRDLPGLRMTEVQMRRCWGFDAVTGEAVLAALVAEHFLIENAQGFYLLADRLMKQV